MTHPIPQFEDRHDAGRQLAGLLAGLSLKDPVVLALPRGGVPVAYEIARILRAPLGVLLVRKLGTPWWPELALGAIAESNRQHRILDPDRLARAGVTPDQLDEQVALLQPDLARRRRMYADPKGTLAPPVRGRTAVVVDDGMATGSTMRAALAALAEEEPDKLLFAVPVAPAETLDALYDCVDIGVCLNVPENFSAVSPYYAEFRQTTDEEVVALLARARNELANSRKENTMQKISEVMTPDVTVAGPQDTLQRAAQLMNERDVGSLPVCDGRRLLGMITDRDITIRAVAEGKSPDQVRVAEIMSEGVSYCYEDQTVDEVLEQLGDEQIRRLPVIDRNMQLVGILALGDIATRDGAHVDQALEDISMPSNPNRGGNASQGTGAGI